MANQSGGRPPERRHQYEAFDLWWHNDRDFEMTAETLCMEVDRLKAWYRLYDWRKRADDRDLKITQKLEQQSLRKRERALANFDALGGLMVNKAGKFYAKVDLDRASDAAQAAKIGVEIQSKALGLPTHLIEVQQMSDQEIKDEYRRLTREIAESVDLEAVDGDETGDGSEGDDF